MNITMHKSTNELMTIAEMFAVSGMFPDGREKAKVATKLVIGQTLGLNPLDSMTGLNMIQGKVVLSASLMANAIKRSTKYDYAAKTTVDACTIEFFEIGPQTSDRRHIGSTTFTIEDAQRAGISNGQNWRKYPKAMLFARCISAGYREHCPDALSCGGPVYVEEHGESEIPDRGNTQGKANKEENQPTRLTVWEEQIEQLALDLGRKSSVNLFVGGGGYNDKLDALEDFLEDNPHNSFTFISHIEWPSAPGGDASALPSPDHAVIELNQPVDDGEGGLISGQRKTTRALAGPEVFRSAMEAVMTEATVTGNLRPKHEDVPGDVKLECWKLNIEGVRKPDPKPEPVNKDELPF